MGREVKRVAIDFKWFEKVKNQRGKAHRWPGYLLWCARESCEGECDICDTMIEPPKGTGWQMWETTTEGSPISPVFTTKEELAYWLANTKASAFGGETATYLEWLAMIDQEFCVSMVTSDGVMKTGVEDALDRKVDE